MEDSGTISIHLSKLNDVSVVDVRGKKCVVIPVEENGIYISPKGTIVLSYFMSKMFEEKYGNTHVLKRKLTKEEYQKSTAEERKRVPDGGYFSPYRGNSGNYNSSQPAQAPKPTYSNNNSGAVGDLPF